MHNLEKVKAMPKVALHNWHNCPARPIADARMLTAMSSTLFYTDSEIVKYFPLTRIHWFVGIDFF
jgi:hypothetical protein